LTDIEDISSKKLITDNLSFDKDTSVGSSSRTFKSQEGKWEENRKFGLQGEQETISLLVERKAKIIDLNYNAPCDACSDIQNWRKYNKLPDGIAKLDQEVFFFDAKAKSSRYFKVNERDYIEYQRKLKFLPVKIYFVIFSFDKKRVKEVYVHNVTSEKHAAELEKEWDKNKMVNLTNELEQLA
jgi:hypothetical protein